MTKFPRSREDAQNMDRTDPLAHLRAAFDLPVGLTYLVGHSLGPAPRSALKNLQAAAQREWASGLVGSWNSADWINLPARTGARIAPLIGVAPEEVTVCDSVSINIFKLAGSLIKAGETAPRLIVEKGEFPTDQYIISELSSLQNAELVHAEHDDGLSVLSAGGVLVKSLVDFRSGKVMDVEAAEQTARDANGAIVWDLSHATGVLDLNLADWGAKFAVGCTYKYLNGGPGAPGFLYVSEDRTHALRSLLPGWLGHARPFAFEDSYEPSHGVNRFISGTPPILSTASLYGALDLFDGLQTSDLEQKANRLGDMCLARFAELGLVSNSPAIGRPRGGHVSIHHADGYAVSRALFERGVHTDFRSPDIIRLGLSPLVLSYEQVWLALEELADILDSESWKDPRFQVRQKVT
tara:strand:- start:3970 stop:5196 length:1227 start_codon:yes stop_codon:yes gene_type:complete